MKKIWMLALALLACGMMAMGCSSGEETTAEETTAEETTEATTEEETTEEETTEAPTTEEATEAETTEAAASSAAAGEASAYLAWGAEEWKAASDEDKLAAAEEVLVQVGNAMMEGFGEMMELAQTDPDAKAELDAQIADMVTQIDSFFATDMGLTLQDLVDASISMVGTEDTTAAE